MDDNNQSSSESNVLDVKSHGDAGTTSNSRSNPRRNRKDSGKSKLVHRSFCNRPVSSVEIESCVEARAKIFSADYREIRDVEITEVLVCHARQRAKKLAARRQDDAAIYEFIKSLALTKIVYGEDHWRLAYAHVLLADAYLELKGYSAQAVEHAEIGRTIMLITPKRPRSARKKADLVKVMTLIYLTIGKAQTKLGKYRMAHRHLHQAASMADEYSTSAKIPKRATKALKCKVLLAIARLHLARKKFRESCQTYKQLLSLTEDVYGVNSTQTIHIHQSLGTTYQLLQPPLHEDALDHFKAAIEIGTSRFKMESKELMKAELLLAKAYLATGADKNNHMAETHLRNIVTCLEDASGSRELLYLESEDLLISLLIISEREKEAIEFITASLPRKRRIFGSCSNQLITTLKLLGSLFLSLGEILPAAKYLKKCLGLELIVFGSSHPNVNNTRQSLHIIHQTASMSTEILQRTS